jgi:hypothetical protein
MKKHFACPGCHAPMTVDPTVDRTAACPECGYRANVRAKPAVRAEAADEPSGSGARPTKRRPKEERRKKTAPSAPARRLWLLVAAGGGVLVVGIVVVGIGTGVLLLRGRGPKQPAQVENDREAIEQAAPANEVPAVAWTLHPGPGPKLVFPDHLAVEYEKGFAREVSLPGRGPEYLSTEGDPGLAGLCYGRFDLKTGKQVGPARMLKDVNGQRVGASLLGGTSRPVTPTAVSPTGTLVIDSGVGGERLLPIYRPDQDSPRTIPGLTLLDTSRRTREPSWFDFSADEKLWVLKGGALVAWDVAAGKPAFTATGRHTLPALMGPDRKWLVAQADDKYLEVLDAATGECRGRFGGEGRWQSLAVSLDGKRLATARFPGDGFGPGADAYDFPVEIHEWDLATGERKAIVSLVRKTNDVRALHWIDADHLLVAEAVVDMKWKMHIASVRAKSDPGSQAPGSLREAGWTADGKRWVCVGSAHLMNQLVSVAIPLDAVAGEPAFHPGDAVRVEARCGDSALDARVAAVLSDALKSYGFRVEGGDWSLRVTATTSETGKKLEFGPGGKALEAAVPEVKGTIELVAPDGTVVATSTHRGFFPMGPGSKYYKGSERPQIIGPGQAQIDLYDFGGRSPAVAMREEAWTNFIRNLPTSAWPRAAWQSGGKHVQLPLTIEVDPQPKADR